MVLLVMLFFSCSTDSEHETEVTTFLKFYGTDYREYPKTAAQTNDGGYVLCGSSYASDYDGYIVKTDSVGNSVWTFIFDSGGYDDETQDILQTSDGDYFVVGSARGEWDEDSFQYSEDIAYTKLNESGQELWTVVSDRGSAYSVAETNDGAFIIAGIQQMNSSASKKAFLSKVDQNGHTLWKKNVNNMKYVSQVQQLKNGNYLLAGYLDSSHINLKRFTNDGTQLWSRNYGQSSWMATIDIKETDNGLILCGTTQVEDTFQSESFHWEVYIVKTDSTGSIEWQKTFINIFAQSGKSIQVTNDNGYIIAGSHLDLTETTMCAALIKIDNLGNELWSKSNCWEKYLAVCTFQSAADGGYFLFGEHGADYFLLKTDAELSCSEDEI